MQRLVCVGREASCVTGWEEIVDEETVSRTTRATKFFSYLLHLNNFHILHLAALPCLKMAYAFWINSKIHLPAFKRIVPRDDVSAVLANQELDSIIKGVQVLLGDRGLRLLDDIQGVRGAQAQRINVAQRLQAAVWVHAIHQAIYRRVSNILEQW